MEKNNVKRNRFVRIVERRVNKTLDDLDNIGRCSNRRNYEYNDDDVKKIFGTIEKKTKEVKQVFQGIGQKKKGFKLETE